MPKKAINVSDLRRFVGQGLSTAEIAATFGVQSPAVIRSCHANDTPLPHGRGAKVGRYPSEPTRADDERDLDIIRRVVAGDGMARIAKAHGISNVTVQKVINSVEAADIAESGEPVLVVAKAYARPKRRGFA